jgi:nucleoside-diphosphate-sugar epimerase
MSYAGKTLLVTGCTGFIGKVLLEKILFASPDVVKVYCLIREKVGKSATERLQEVANSKCFDRLRDRHGDGYFPFFFSKVIAVQGDTSAARLGLDPADEHVLTRHVDVILNNAASVKFDDRIGDAASKNIYSALQCAAVARSCRRLEALVHTSTSYVNCHIYETTGTGTKHTPTNLVQRRVAEHICVNGAAALTDYNQVMRLQSQANSSGPNTNATKVDTARAQLLELEAEVLRRYPNTYCWSKALAEAVLRDACVGQTGTDRSETTQIPLAVVRPSIVSCSLREPFPGWIDSKDASGGYFMLYGIGGVRCTVIDHGCVDMVPVDVVVNTLLLAGLAVLNTSTLLNGTRDGQDKLLDDNDVGSDDTGGDSVLVCHAGTSSDNPLRKSEVMPCVYRYWAGTHTRRRLSLPVRVPPPPSASANPTAAAAATSKPLLSNRLGGAISNLWSGPFGHTFDPARERWVHALRMYAPMRALQLTQLAVLDPLCFAVDAAGAAVQWAARMVDADVGHTHEELGKVVVNPQEADERDEVAGRKAPTEVVTATTQQNPALYSASASAEGSADAPASVFATITALLIAAFAICSVFAAHALHVAAAATASAIFPTAHAARCVRGRARKAAKLLDVSTRARGLFTYFFTHTFVFEKTALRGRLQKVAVAMRQGMDADRADAFEGLCADYDTGVTADVLDWHEYLHRCQWGLQNYVMGESTQYKYEHMRA